MPPFIKSWLLHNMFELSTVIGFVILVRELLAFNTSILMVGISLMLIFISDTKINGYIQSRTPGLKAWIEKL